MQGSPVVWPMISQLSGKQRPDPYSPKARPQIALAQVEGKVQEDVMASYPDIDWKGLARESLIWLDELPQAERSAAGMDLKEWVESAGLNWDLWWQYCRQQMHPTPCDGDGLPKRPGDGSPKRQVPTAGGPVFLGHSKGVPRELAQPEFKIVPPALQAYNAQLRERARGLFEGIRGTSSLPKAGKPAAAAPRLMERPIAEDQWLSMAIDALIWLSGKAKEERPMAMAEMRQWVIESGLDWDQWWAYCRSVRGARKKHRMSQMNLPKGQTKPEEDSLREFSHRRAVTLDHSEMDRRKVEAEHKERALRRQKTLERKAKEEARLAQHAQWEQESNQKLAEEYREAWKKSSREYSSTLFASERAKLSAEVDEAVA
jgi:hypothetical protein